MKTRIHAEVIEVGQNSILNPEQIHILKDSIKAIMQRKKQYQDAQEKYRLKQEKKRQDALQQKKLNQQKAGL